MTSNTPNKVFCKFSEVPLNVNFSIDRHPKKGQQVYSGVDPIGFFKVSKTQGENFEFGTSEIHPDHPARYVIEN